MDINQHTIKKYPPMPKGMPVFDFHPIYGRTKAAYIAINEETGIPIGDNPQHFPSIKFAEHGYLTEIITLGDRNLLTGKAFEYYEEKKKQLERDMITSFQQHDIFINEKQTLMIIVSGQKDNVVTYRKHVVPNEKKGKAWEFPSIKEERMLVHTFALSVVKLNPLRYSKLIHPEMLIPK